VRVIGSVNVNERRLHFFIDGRSVDAGARETLPVTNPATGSVIAGLPVATERDIDLALEAAHRAFPAWRDSTPLERGTFLRRAAALLRERAAAIAELTTSEQGGVLARSRAEVLRSADVLDWCAEEGRRAYGRLIPSNTRGTRQLVLRQAIGPAAALTPWNAPAFMPCRKIGEALAAGCTCVIKPAEETPSTALEIMRALADAGLPPGVVNMVFGIPADISRRLVTSVVTRKISFTGSTRVGMELGALAGGLAKPITLELGGHAPVLVFEDADVDLAADLTAAMKINNGGQLCGSPTRILVHESVYAKFLERLRTALAATRVGSGMDPDTQMGPLANMRRVTAMESFVADAQARGAKVQTGGERPASRGFYFAPTLLSGVGLDCEIMNREPFGPICALVPFRSAHEAIAEANRLEFGLAAYAFTRSARIADELMQGVESGLLGINTFAVAGPESPLGGVKHSGYGTEGGSEGIASYLVTKFVAHATH
jgi:succinate-semialdehyde dehydrogenase / glutarate-semialdehyde dehydrogenase